MRASGARPRDGARRQPRRRAGARRRRVACRVGRAVGLDADAAHARERRGAGRAEEAASAACRLLRRAVRERRLQDRAARLLDDKC
jgi:hypothetical protein